MAEHLAIIAGRGNLPALIIAAAAQQGRQIFILAIKGDTNPEMVASHPHRWIEMSDIASTLAILRAEGIREVVMAGGMSRPSLKALKPNAVTAKLIARIGKSFFGGDDALLKAVVSVFEEEGFKVLAPNELLEDLLAPEGVLTHPTPSRQALADIESGIGLMQDIGRLDIGQALIICNGQVIGVEALEGTDALIARCGELMAIRGEQYRGVLIKLKKINQESRVDLPSIGVETIRNLQHWGFSGVALEAGGSLIIEKQEALSYANQHGLWIKGVKVKMAAR